MAELGDGEVGGERGLAAFFSDDTNAYIRGLDHGDVVATVADAADALLGEISDQMGDVCFLGRGATAGDYCGE